MIFEGYKQCLKTLCKCQISYEQKMCKKFKSATLLSFQDLYSCKHSSKTAKCQQNSIKNIIIKFFMKTFFPICVFIGSL